MGTQHTKNHWLLCHHNRAPLVNILNKIDQFPELLYSTPPPEQGGNQNHKPISKKDSVPKAIGKGKSRELQGFRGLQGQANLLK